MLNQNQKYLILNKIEVFISSLFDIYKDILFDDSIKSIMHGEAINISKMSNFQYEDILNLMHQLYFKKLNIYQLEKNKIKKTKRINMKHN